MSTPLWEIADWDPEVALQNTMAAPPNKFRPLALELQTWTGRGAPMAGHQIAVPPGSPFLQPGGITANIRPKGEPMPFNIGGFLNNAARALTGQPMQFPSGANMPWVGPVAPAPAPTAVAPVPLAMGFLPAIGRVIGRGVIGRGKTVRDIAIGAVAGEVIGSAFSGNGGGGGAMTTAQARSGILAQAAANVGLRRVQARDLRKMAQLVGWQDTADYYGLSALDVGFVVANMPKRRRRGITAADVRRVRSTARKFDSLKRALSGIGTSTRRRSYRSSTSKASASCR